MTQHLNISELHKIAYFRLTALQEGLEPVSAVKLVDVGGNAGHWIWSCSSRLNLSCRHWREDRKESAGCIHTGELIFRSKVELVWSLLEILVDDDSVIRFYWYSLKFYSQRTETLSLEESHCELVTVTHISVVSTDGSSSWMYTRQVSTRWWWVSC